MRKSFIISAVFFLLFPFISTSSLEQPGRPEAAIGPPGVKAQVMTAKNLPLEFIPNVGQTDGRVSFYIKGSDRTIYFTPKGMTLALHKETTAVKPGRKELLTGPKERKPSPTESWVVKMDFIGARKDVVPEGLEKSGAVFSYFKGSREDWHTGLPGYRRIIYRDLWPGVDLVYKGDVGRLKYEFIVGPGAAPSLIQLGIRGVKGVAVDKEGRLVIDTPLEKIIDEWPIVFQEGGAGGKNFVAAGYAVDTTEAGDAVVSFILGDYDRALPLVIDPATLVYCGYIGGSQEDYGNGIAVDGSGCAYITGLTWSSEATFPVGVGPDLAFNGPIDAFVAKVNASGTGLEYCGYIGGSDIDEGYGIAVDSWGNAYVTGYTSSDQTSFPAVVGPDLTYNGDCDAFVARVNAWGTGLIYCGYIGGWGLEIARDIAVDSWGNAYVTGYTSSDQTSFPVVVGPDLTFNGGDNDAFVAKVNASGTGLGLCGYIGGSSNDPGDGIAIDISGRAYITGTTASTETTFPVRVGPDLTHNGGFDVFVARVNADGKELDYCGYFGGSSHDRSFRLAVDGSGSAYITGWTVSTETTFPVVVGPDLTFNGGTYDAFVAKVNSSGTGLVFCGYVGGSDYDAGYGIAVDGSGSAYITGRTTSTETTFPVGVGPDLTFNGDNDAFVAKVNASGTGLVFCGYIGGSSADYGCGIAVDGLGNAFVTGATYSDQTSFPAVVGPDLTFNNDYNDYKRDAFVAKISSTFALEKFADISVSKSVNNIRPYTGDEVAFTVSATNLGPDVATGLTLRDALPAGLTFVSASTTQGTYDPAAGLWNVGGLGNSVAAWLTLRAAVAQEGTLTNTAAVKALNETDRDTHNNTASASLTAEHRIYAPSNFQVQRLDNDLIFSKEYINRLSWAANPLNRSVIVQYRLYRKIKGREDSWFALYKLFDGSVTTFDDRGLRVDEKFTYRITSVSASGRESDPIEAGN